ncbi:MAG: TonB-dependent receptor domain-containing protein [Brevundimonas sp.]|uniref:TonB-dependent receptor n=1 Tax=Brevundimonas sp. TaxID=1871086 RepID=UPI00391FA5C5
MLASIALVAAAAPAVILAVAPTAASAQDFTTGTIEGTVLNTSGQPVSGVTVTVSQNGRSLTRSFTTGASGEFRASQIPVGSYTVTISGAGYESYTDANVPVTLGSTADFDFVIRAVGAATSVDEIVVVGTRSSAVDFNRTTTGVTVNVQETFDRIPTARNLAAIQLLAPTTTQGDAAFGNEISISGSSVGENVYYLNGFNITNFRNFVGGNTVPFEFYDQVDVKTGGFQAEFGRSTGGAVIAVSRSGGDQFEGGFNYYIEPEDLRGEVPDTYVGPGSSLGLDSLDTAQRQDANVWLSGPIWRDHAYFFGFYNWRDIETGSTDTAGTVQTGVRDDPFYGGKLDLLLNQDHRLEITYFSDDQTQVINQRFSNGDSSNTFNFDGGETTIVKYTGNLTDWFTLSALYGEGSFNQTVSGDLDGEISIVDTALNIVRGNPALLISQGEDERTMYRIDGDLYVNGLFGDHHFRFGYDREDLASSAVSLYSGGRYYRYYLAGSGGALGGRIAPNTVYVRDRNYQSGGAYETEQEAFYVQDAWDVTDRLSLQLGLRAEKFSNFNAAGEVFVETDFDISPRLGMTYDVFGDRTTSLRAFYGRYYIPIAANTNIRMAGNELFTQDFYNISNIAGSYPATVAGLNACLAASPRNNCLPTLSGAPVLAEVLSPGVVPESQSLVSENLEAQYQDEFIVGVQHEVTNFAPLDGWNFSATYIYRDLKSVMEDFDTNYIIENYCDFAGIAAAVCGSINGAGYVLLNPGKDLIITPDSSTFPALAGQTITIPASILDIPEATRTYRALELVAERPWDGLWSLRASAVFAESKGNIEGGVKSDNGQSDTGLTQDFDEPGWTDGSYGFLPNHRGQTFKIFGSWAVTEDVTVGFNAILQSPRKYGCIGSYPFSDGRASRSTITAWYCNRTGAPGAGVLTPRGSQFEGEWFKNVDVSLAWNLPMSAVPGRLQLRADVFNVFDFESATDFVETGELSTDSSNPDYQRISAYQTPRTVRVGVSYRF